MKRHFIGANRLAHCCLHATYDRFDRVFWLPGGCDAEEPSYPVERREALAEDMLDADETYVVGLQQMIPNDWLHYRCVIGCHPTLLPYGRGGSPIQHQILEDAPAGLTFFRLEGDVDAGNILGQVALPRARTSEEYYANCCRAAPALLAMVIDGDKRGAEQCLRLGIRKRLTDFDQLTMSQDMRERVYSGPYRRLLINA